MFWYAERSLDDETNGLGRFNDTLIESTCARQRTSRCHQVVDVHVSRPCS